jgi:hypothetical protein
MEQIWDQLAGRLEGPFVFRFILQPVMAVLFAVRAGLKDARGRRAPYLWTVLLHPSERPQLLREGFKDVAKVFILAIVLDLAYQWIVFRWVYPLQALFVAALLAQIPYVIVRGPITRIAGRVRTQPVSQE